MPKTIDFYGAQTSADLLQNSGKVFVPEKSTWRRVAHERGFAEQ